MERTNYLLHYIYPIVSHFLSSLFNWSDYLHNRREWSVVVEFVSNGHLRAIRKTRSLIAQIWWGESHFSQNRPLENVSSLACIMNDNYFGQLPPTLHLPNHKPLFVIFFSIEREGVKFTKPTCSNHNCSTLFSKISTAWQKNINCSTEKVCRAHVHHFIFKQLINILTKSFSSFNFFFKSTWHVSSNCNFAAEQLFEQLISEHLKLLSLQSKVMVCSCVLVADNVINCDFIALLFHSAFQIKTTC